jgi:hypothetical protein
VDTLHKGDDDDDDDYDNNAMDDRPIYLTELGTAA